MELQELTQLLKDVSKKVDLVYEALLGDPTNPFKPGVMLRLDRVEQSSTVIKRMYWVIFPIVLTAIAALIVSSVT